MKSLREKDSTLGQAKGESGREREETQNEWRQRRSEDEAAETRGASDEEHRREETRMEKRQDGDCAAKRASKAMGM